MASKPKVKSVKKSAASSSTTKRDEYQLLMEDALNRRASTLTKAQREGLLLTIDDARNRLVSAAEKYAWICKSDVWIGQIRTLGEDIGHTQDDKGANPQRRSTPVPGDSGYLLESTHQAMARVLHDRDNPPLSQSCNMVVDMLIALRDMDEAAQSLGLPPRSETYYHQYVESTVVPRNCYVFLLYLTYLRVQLPSDSAQLKTLNDLLDHYRLLAILSHFPAGVHDCFAQFNGLHRFSEHGGTPFENRYHYDRVVRPGDTLLGLIQLYPGWDVTTEPRLLSMREHNPTLASVDPSQELLKLNPPVTQIRMVPPKTQTASYASRINMFAKAREQQKESVAQMTRELLAPNQKPIAVLNPACIDTDRFIFNWRGLPLQMGNRVEFHLLKILVDKYPGYVTNQAIMDRIWGGNLKEVTLRVTATRLRNMLKKANVQEIIIDGTHKGHLGIKVRGD